MNTRKMRIAALALAVCLSGTAQAALQGRDLNGSIDSFEAYYDTVLDITWLADANYGAGSSYDDVGLLGTIGTTSDGRMTWASANAWVANLSFTDGINVYDNWRLPTVKPVNGTSFNYDYSANGSTDVGPNITSPQNEMSYMFYVNLGNPGYHNPTGSDSGCYGGVDGSGCLDNVGPFKNLRENVYWSGTEYAPNVYYAWHFHMEAGDQDAFSKISDGSAWAVSNGDVGIAAAVPEPETYAMMLAGLGLVGAMARRRKQAEV